jgi:hypothetical protein
MLLVSFPALYVMNLRMRLYDRLSQPTADKIMVP